MGSEDDASESRDERRVLSPEELDIAEREEVVEIGEDRFVVSSSGGRPNVDLDTVEEATAGESAVEPLDEETVQAWLAERLAESDTRYGFAATGRFEGRTAHRTHQSDDVVEAFGSLLEWFCRNLDGDGPEEVLGILLSETTLRPTIPERAVREYVAASDLDPEDSIADLLHSAPDEGFRFPPR